MKLKVTEEISPSQVKDLINYSNTDELILKTTKDSARFKDKNTFDDWSKKNRKIYTLSDEKGKLLGIIWFGKKQIPNGNGKFGITFAIRIYAEARGKGNAKPFMEEAFGKYKQTKEYKENPAKGIWLETRTDNIAAIKAYERFGFREIETKEYRVLMVLKD